MGVFLTSWNSLIIWLLCIDAVDVNPNWGFYAHRTINEYAVYALPNALRQYFIQDLEYLSQHAVDADMRRYATKTEAFQHYFDTERWGDCITTGGYYDRGDLLRLCQSWYYINQSDTVWLHDDTTALKCIQAEIPNYFTGDEWDGCELTVFDTMAHHGLLPLRIINRYWALVRAFQSKENETILKLAADLGHYIGDAHVPLHTTQNYNGQLTNQNGIHALWETSIPELLAEGSFDFVVGRANYLRDIKTATWDLLWTSHSMVEDVLSIEKELRAEWPDDREVCPDNRNGQPTFQPCADFVLEYNERMHGMVEQQMKRSIKTLADFWWSAYVEAGQPMLNRAFRSEASDAKKNVRDEKVLQRCD